MYQLTRLLGLLLIILGFAAYFGTGQESFTPLIPSFFGVVFVVLAALSKKENLKKHAMHVSAGLAMLGILGTARAIPGVLNLISGEEVVRPVAIYAQFAMFLMCLVYMIRAVQSFRAARKSRDI